ncbi:MAG: hypothetical protein V7731_09040 [Amphritea sp.]
MVDIVMSEFMDEAVFEALRIGFSVQYESELIARKAKSIDMKVSAYDPMIPTDFPVWAGNEPVLCEGKHNGQFNA